MNDFKKLVSAEQSIYLVDQGVLTAQQHFDPFILTDIFTELAGNQKKIILHFWQLSQTMILGMKDTRVLDLKKGLLSLKNNHYDVVVRNAGGLGVIADSGILNVSLILPNSEDHKHSIDHAYLLMLEWIKLAFQDFPIKIEAFEIPTSYCPGTYDLSINGKKFAGIAQRRVKNGLAVMIYLSITGNQFARGETVKAFYKDSLGAQFGENGYPAVDPDSMANLEDLLHTTLTIAEVKNRLKNAIDQINHESLDTTTLLKEISRDWFKNEKKRQFDRMVQRNELIE
ncbi:lipoate--protein ligase family protein [Enterococcus sp. LJL99]